MAGSKIEAVIELTLFLYMTWLSSMLAPFTADFSQYGGKDMPVVLGYILLSANDPQMERALLSQWLQGHSQVWLSLYWLSYKPISEAITY